MKMPVLITALTAVLISFSARVDALMMPGQIRVNECVPNIGTPSQSWVGPWGGLHTSLGTPATLTIHYVNKSTKTASAIEFALVANNRALAVVRDNGKFSTNAVIKHVFNIANNIGFVGTDLTYCVPLRIHYTDGSVWTNPQLPEHPPV
jgi:hypothetical protein